MFNQNFSAGNDQNQWEGLINQLNNPTNYVNNILSQYIKSPMAQQQMGQSMAASNAAQAASGVSGSPQLTQALQGTAQNAAYQGQGNYLNAALQHLGQQMNLHSVLAGQAEQQREAKKKQDSDDKNSTMSTVGTVAALAIMLL